MDLRETQKRIFQNKINKGFNTTDINKEFCLLYGEVAEAYDAVRKNNVDFALELADIAIYLMGIAEMSGIDLVKALEDKIDINEKRTYKKNENGEWIRGDKQQDSTIIFCTHNPGKVQRANKYFDGLVQFETVDYDIPEIRGTIEEIAIAKVKDAYKRIGKPTIAMDAGFEIESLNNYPGSYVNHTLETIGVDGILKLMESNFYRECEFTQCLAYYDGTGEPVVFHGSHKGVLSYEKRGVISSDDWSDLSLIFIPTEEVLGAKRTLAELSHEERIELTKRKDENINSSAFKAFKEWFVEKKS